MLILPVCGSCRLLRDWAPGDGCPLGGERRRCGVALPGRVLRCPAGRGGFSRNGRIQGSAEISGGPDLGAGARLRGCCGVSLIWDVCRFWGGLAHRRDFPGGGNFPDFEKRRRLRAEIGASVVAAVRHYLRRRCAWRQRVGLFRNLRRDGFGAAARDAGVGEGGGFMYGMRTGVGFMSCFCATAASSGFRGRGFGRGLLGLERRRGVPLVLGRGRLGLGL